MFKARWALLALALAGCASPPTTDEIALVNSAPKPSSPAAVEAAVKRYFDNVLVDGPSARWRFTRPPIRGAWVPRISSGRLFGWFVCGEVNPKNRMGGYVGWRPFFAHFSPTQRDVVDDGTLDDVTDKLNLVASWCEQLYAMGRYD